MSSLSPTKKKRRKHPRDMSPEELEQAIAKNMDALTRDYDEKFTRGVAHELVDLVSVYFRPEYYGFDNLPPERSNPERPIIFAANHSGMAFPWDALMLGAGLMDRYDFDMTRLFRPLAAPMLSASNLMCPYLLDNAWKRIGALDASSLNFETLMNQERYNVLIYPEGVPGIGKGFNRRYQLQTFSTSMIRMALKYRTDIISVFCINAEYLNPHAYRLKWLNRLVNKIGVPFFFIGILTIPLLLFPFLFYSGLPAKLIYVRGKRYKPYEMTDMSWEEMTQEDIRRIRDEVQQGMQEEITGYAEQYGKKPYRMGELWRNLKKHWRDFPYTTPLGWPAVFTEYDRLYHRNPDEAPEGIIRGWFKFWRIVFRNPIVICYFLPLIGWIPIVWRGLRGRRKVKAWSGSKV